MTDEGAQELERKELRTPHEALRDDIEPGESGSEETRKGQEPNDGVLEEKPSKQDDDTESQGPGDAGPVYSVFSTWQIRYIVMTASWAGLFSPLSSSIYFPALNTLANDLGVTNALINLTLTSYMIFQGLAPMVLGDLADTAGRRPAYAVCFIIYIGANIGLALQHNYAALLVLRCLQSTGSSATIALSSGVVADVATPARRGSYIGLANAGSLLGPSLGPVIGGLLSHYLGWQSIFWFLLILAAAFTLQFAIFFPETSRRIVGNGSIPPQKWNVSVVTYLKTRKGQQESVNADAASFKRPKLRFPNPTKSILLVFEKETSLVLASSSLTFAGYYILMAATPSVFNQIYALDDLQIGLCYLPLGVGAGIASVVNGYILDHNYRRLAKALGMPMMRNRQQDTSNFPIEKARVQVSLPSLYASCLTLITLGWLLHFEVHIAAPLVMMFVAGAALTAAVTTINTLIVDLHSNCAATATASNNLVRCLLGAGATALVDPMLNGMGRGWCFTCVAFVMIATAPLLTCVVKFGPKWREERRVRELE